MTAESMDARPIDPVSRDADLELRLRARRAAIAGGVGTLIEYYDFSLYGYLAIVMAPLFFHSDSAATSLLSALAVFGTAYLMRPLGGLAFGYIGDRFGRRRALLGTLMCMGVGSVAMGLLPTYEQAGVWAVILLVIIRLLQGFSAGGEVGGSATFISESAPKHLKATYAAFTPLGSTFGFGLAAAAAGAVSLITTDAQMNSWGWRLPFLLALPLMVVCLWARRRVDETYLPDETEVRERPLLTLFRTHSRAVAQAVGLSLAINGTAYICLTYMSIHLTKTLGYDRTAVYWISFGVLVISALGMLVGGRLADRFGRVRITAVSLVFISVVSYPAMAGMDLNLRTAAILYLLMMLSTVGIQVGVLTLMPLLFDQNVRFTGVATSYNIGVIIAGGSAPLIAVSLVEWTGDNRAPAYFVMAVAAIGLLSLLSITRKSAVSARHSAT
ncbi:MFS transporter [Rhodococcus sp. LB1]|uniref:MFS transporter n=1 Tax=Rhodococcus sp. LB1 TaxID=1807499 RepID=UPI000B2C044D|nr:MFS transporter [Rhodococcus sp. LB1]